MVDASGRRLGGDHDHSGGGEGGATLSPDDLDIGGSDFIASGDVDNKITLCPMSRGFSTTSTTYDEDTSQFDARVSWEKILTSNGNLAVAASFGAVVGTDETVDVRIQDVANGETVVEETGIESTGSYYVGYLSHSPTDLQSTVRLRAQIRTNPGNNSSQLLAPHVFAGVQL